MSSSKALCFSGLSLVSVATAPSMVSRTEPVIAAQAIPTIVWVRARRPTAGRAGGQPSRIGVHRPIGLLATPFDRVAGRAEPSNQGGTRGGGRTRSEVTAIEGRAQPADRRDAGPGAAPDAVRGQDLHRPPRRRPLLGLSPTTEIVEELRDLRYLEMLGLEGRDYQLDADRLGGSSANERMQLCRYAGSCPGEPRPSTSR